MEILFSCFFVTLETLGLIRIADIHFKRRYDGFKAFVGNISLSIVMIVFLAGGIMSSINSALKSLTAIILLFVLLNLFYSGNKKKKIFLACVYYSLICGIDYLITIAYMILFQVDVNQLYGSIFSTLLSACLSKTILLFLCYIYSKKAKSKKQTIKLSLLEWCCLLVIPFCLILNLNVVIFEAIETQKTNSIIVLDTILLICGIFIYLYLEEELERRKLESIENSIFKQKMSTEMQRINLIKEHLKEQRILTHDFNNHLAVIRDLLNHNAHNKDILNYIEELTEKTEKTMQIIKTNNQVVDIVLNQKYSLCKKNNIPMFFELNNLEQLPITDKEIIIILSNVLDNAIEECMRLDKNKYVKVKFLHDKSNVILSVKNPTDKLYFQFSEQQLTTSKEDVFLHGYGLKNVTRAVTDSGGISGIECKNGVFQFTVIWS